MRKPAATASDVGLATRDTTALRKDDRVSISAKLPREVYVLVRTRLAEEGSSIQEVAADFFAKYGRREA
jgi:hypothetical protein